MPHSMAACTLPLGHGRMLPKDSDTHERALTAHSTRNQRFARISPPLYIATLPSLRSRARTSLIPSNPKRTHSRILLPIPHVQTVCVPSLTPRSKLHHLPMRTSMCKLFSTFQRTPPVPSPFHTEYAPHRPPNVRAWQPTSHANTRLSARHLSAPPSFSYKSSRITSPTPPLLCVHTAHMTTLQILPTRTKAHSFYVSSRHGGALLPISFTCFACSLQARDALT